MVAHVEWMKLKVKSLTMTTIMLFAMTCASNAAEISGTITNGSTKDGWVTVGLMNQNGGSSGLGTAVRLLAGNSITYTIVGVTDGDYSLEAYLDATSTGIRHANDPAAIATPLTVINNQNIFRNLTIGISGTATLNSSVSFNIVTTDKGAFVKIDESNMKDGSGRPIPDSYTLSCNAGSINVTIPSGFNTFAMLSGLSNGTSLSCDAVPVVSGLADNIHKGSVSSTVGDCNSAGNCAGGTAHLTGKVDLSSAGDLTGKSLYVAVVSPTGGIKFVGAVASPLSNPVTVDIYGVSSGTYKIYTILDNGDHVIGSGDLQTQDINAPVIVVNGLDAVMTLPTISIKPPSSPTNAYKTFGAYHGKRYQTPIDYDYNFVFQLSNGLKRPVRATIKALDKSTVLYTVGRGQSDPVFLFNGPNMLRPTIGSIYGYLDVLYDDSSSETDIALTFNRILDDFGTVTFPKGNVRLPDTSHPKLSWSTPGPLPGYNYSYRAQLNNFTPNGKDPNDFLLSSTLYTTFDLVGNGYSALSNNVTTGWNLYLNDQFGNSTNLANQYNQFTPRTVGPVITSISTPSLLMGASTLGSSIVINGSGFTGATSVTINGKQLNYTVDSDNQITISSSNTSLTCGPILVTAPATDPVFGPLSVTGASSDNFIGLITVSGTIKNSASATISGATIKLVGANPLVSVSTSGSGTYSLPNIPAGIPFMQQVTPPVSNPNNYLPVYTKSVFNSSNGTSFDWTLYTAAEVAAWGVSPGKGVIRARVSENLPPSGATNSNISGATVTASSWLHPDVPYIVKYDNGSGLPGTGISTLTNGVFYVMNVDEGDIVTVDSLANGYTFQSLGYKVHADAVSQGRIIGAAAPTGIVATTAATANGDGSYSGTIQVCFSLTPSATYYGQIYYTTDGSDPRFYGASLAIGATFSLSSTATVRYVFRSTISNTVGPIGSTTFNWPPAPVTSISLPGNTYNHGPISVTLTPNGPASTYYCLGSGCTPTTPYTGPIAINTSQALNYYSMDSAGNTEITKTAVYTINVTLSVNLAGSGAGNVNSITAQFPFACNTGACSPMTFTYGANSTITLAETPSTSVFSGWDGACVDKSSNCTITMDGDKNVTAFFDTTPVLKLLGPPDSYHHIPSEALSAMTDNTSVTLQGQATTISNDFTLNRPITIKFSGGYDAGFQPKSGSSKTVIAGKVTISSGKLIVDKLAIVGSNVNGTFQSGVFMNSSVVQGLDYATPSISGVTDTNGTYMYNPGETAVFSVGCLELGSTLGKSPVTLFDLVPTALSINDQRLINISKFLQSLSTVTDVTTRIVLTDAVKNAICSAGGINFNQSSVDFASDINVINVLNATGKSLLSDPQVIANLNSQAIRTTSFGKVAGMYSPDSPAFVWSDIPYAAPPINALRWKPPVDPASWATTKTVTTTPNVCMQKGNVYSKVLGIIRKIPQSEDCLTLNIWSPVTGESNLPVIVYVHGGSNMTGYGFSNMQWGGALVAEQKVVFVSINYRLNLFGWLNHPALHTGDSINDSGNFGTLDIIQALKFVKNNIASFGGDPNNITLAGQSAGAGNTWSLITSPMSAGLFHKAVPMSHGWTLATVQGGQNYANMILQQMLIRDGYATDVTSASAYLLNMSNTDISNYLYSQTADQIVGILSTATVASTNGGNVSSKFLDGTVLPPDSATAFSGNYLNSVPVLSGTTNEEGKWYGSYFAISNTAWSNMLNSDPDSPTLTVADVIQPQYLPADKPFTSCTDSGYNAINLNAAFVNGDTSTYCINYTNNTTRFWQLQINALNRYQPLQQKTYAYNFAWAQQAEPMKTLIGAAHVADVPFMLNTMTQNTQLSSGFSTVNKPGRDDLSLKMRQSLSAFMRTGDPNNPNLGVTWLPWSTVPGEAKRLIFDADYNFSNISMSTSDTQIPR